MIKTVKFAKPTHRDSVGRNRYVKTTGLEIYDSGDPRDEPDRDGSICLCPINSRDKVTESCRVSIARSALPEVIAALQEIAGVPDKCAKACQLLVDAYTKAMQSDGGSVKWEDVDIAHAAAIIALGLDECSEGRSNEGDV